MKTLFTILSLLALVAASPMASADWGHGPGGPGWGHGPGPGHGGPGWGGPGHGYPPPPPPPGWGGPGHGGPGWGGPGHGYPPPPPPPRTEYVQCSSGGYSFNTCYVSGYVQSAQLVRQESSASCNLGQTWGYQQNTIWVDKGCRGTFLVYLY